ncbi:hypothetical protein [Streptomyces sp. EN23]|uniref:hypothetical protein n=1 Tax=Streptomyces sp. EN23 TaxID=212774 RepID=UPI000851FC88|nr:hypothetical protein [Streptomyces sp. EN23]
MDPTDALIAISRRCVPGCRFPGWAVPSRSGHLVGLVSEIPADPWRPWQLRQTIRAQTLAGLVNAGLVTLGELEPVPEYEGGRRGLCWEEGRTGHRLSVTDAGRAAGGSWLPLDLP